VRQAPVPVPGCDPWRCGIHEFGCFVIREASGFRVAILDSRLLRPESLSSLELRSLSVLCWIARSFLVAVRVLLLIFERWRSFRRSSMSPGVHSPWLSSLDSCNSCCSWLRMTTTNQTNSTNELADAFLGLRSSGFPSFPLSGEA
jgi:hypothetical protein